MNPETRLRELRKEIEAETISYGEIAELQDLAETHRHLFANDPLLAEWSGIPEQEWQQLHKPGPRLIKRLRTSSEYRLSNGTRVIYSGTPGECRTMAEADNADDTTTKG